MQGVHSNGRKAPLSLEKTSKQIQTRLILHKDKVTLEQAQNKKRNARRPQGGMEFHAGGAHWNRQFDSVCGVPTLKVGVGHLITLVAQW